MQDRLDIIWYHRYRVVITHGSEKSQVLGLKKVFLWHSMYENDDDEMAKNPNLSHEWKKQLNSQGTDIFTRPNWKTHKHASHYTTTRASSVYSIDWRKNTM